MAQAGANQPIYRRYALSTIHISTTHIERANTMKTLKLENFDIDADTSATIAIYDEIGVRLGCVKFGFADLHTVEIDLPSEPYYVQTAVADEAAQLLDSRFNDDAETYDEKSIEL